MKRISYIFLYLILSVSVSFTLHNNPGGKAGDLKLKNDPKTGNHKLCIGAGITSHGMAACDIAFKLGFSEKVHLGLYTDIFGA